MSKRTAKTVDRQMADRKAADAAIQKRLHERYYSDPSIHERGLEILAGMAVQNDLAKSLAVEFEAAWTAERAIEEDDYMPDEEYAAAHGRTQVVAEKITAIPSTSILMMQLKARAYMWSEGCTDLEDLSPARDTVSDPILVSLFRDLGADRVLAEDA